MKLEEAIRVFGDLIEGFYKQGQITVTPEGCNKLQEALGIIVKATTKEKKDGK